MILHPPTPESTMDGTAQLSRILLLEAIELISQTTIRGVLVGIIVVLYILCACSLYPGLKGPHHQRQTRFTFVCASVVVICEVVSFAVYSRAAEISYVNNNKFPGEVVAHETQDPDDQLMEFPGAVFDVISDSLALGIQIWRLWAIWSATQYAVIIIILPSLLLLSYEAMNLITGFEQLSQRVFPQGAGFGAALVAALGLEAAFTILVTTLVVVRLMLVRRRHINLMGTSETSVQYMGIAAMLVESYALESAWSLAAAALYVVRAPISPLFFYCDIEIKVIAYLLVVYRVSTGRAWSRQTERQMSSLRWNHNTYSTTSETATQTPGTLSNTIVDPSSMSHSSV